MPAPLDRDRPAINNSPDMHRRCRPHCPRLARPRLLLFLLLPLGGLLALAPPWHVTPGATPPAHDAGLAPGRHRADCGAVERRVDECPAAARAGAATTIACVDACWRWGTCHVHCGGLGDGMLGVLAALLRALDRCEALRIDHTFGGVLQLRRPGMAYRDPLHIGWPFYRAYDGQEREFGSGPADAATGPVYHMRRGLSPRQIESWASPAARWPVPCVFHSVFRVDRGVGRRAAATAAAAAAIVGVHFRVGDAQLAPTLQANDRRARATDVFAMLRCAERLAADLGADAGRARFFVATDSEHAKRLVDASPWAPRVTVSPVRAKHTYHHPGTLADAWHDVLVLAQLRGLVLNRVMANYSSTARPTSSFGELAGLIGNATVVRCAAG